MNTLLCPTQPKSSSMHMSPSLNYSIQKLLKSTASANRFKLFNSDYHKPHSIHKSKKYIKNQTLPTISLKLEKERQQLEYFVNNSHSKLNQSFSHYHMSEVNVNRELLRKQKVTKSKKVEQKTQTFIEVPKTQHEDGAYHQVNLKVTLLPNQCFDSMFPIHRDHPALFTVDKQIYLLGGYRQAGSGRITCFHKYDKENSRWLQVKQNGDVPKISLTYHTTQIYKNHLLVVGGTSLDVQKGTRYNNDILVFNMQKGQWLKSKQGVSIKSHASILFGSTLMICGGTNQKNKFNQELFFVTFTGGNLQTPMMFSVRNNSDSHDKLIGHKMIHTYEMDPNYKAVIKLDGIFSFGGEDQQQKLNNDLMYMNVIGKNSQNLDIKFKKWQTVLTNEDRPCPRKNHTFNILNKKGIALLAGGIDQMGSWLMDLWLFDLMSLHWRRINNQPIVQRVIGNMGGHVTCSYANSIFLFNGNTDKKRDRAFVKMQFDPNPFKSKKNIYSTKLPTVKTINSFKENQISNSQI